MAIFVEQASVAQKRKQFLFRLNFGVFSDAAEGVSPRLFGFFCEVLCEGVPPHIIWGFVQINWVRASGSVRMGDLWTALKRT